ncbi:unnamed protein product [Candida parapsilosis]|uniref:Oxidant-induced cell-cycle arrest protein 5 n=2 Tax=Candida parapsilosis TaxID=5480 RepID=G8B9Q0_CANPC|nr:uncharacterized protein CPAR2_303400 [Candida parapsilosis]KAF6044286.1 Rab-GTPase-TBC domain family protein [Candida parapsilosis]KAF6050186.1 Rab-GTPase-TBC domain family protein [Candida parapsilosis]KAI5907882.1 GTPase-activating protein GYP3 [Candida parapsilosis]CAD1811830.1 unnamed protein product [Candida parapsilosis]CCE41351.1 hypothetical protein CPAR2_303400 [Candida parapsilosis]
MATTVDQNIEQYPSIPNNHFGPNNDEYHTLDPGSSTTSFERNVQHQRNESSYSRNFSILDTYAQESPSRRNSYIDVGIPSPLQDINSDTSIIKSFDVSTQNNSTTNLDQNGFVSIDNSSATALDTSSERDSYIKPTTEESDAEILKSDFDRYGFKKSTSQGRSVAEYNAWFEQYSEYTIRRKKKWERVMKDHGLHILTASTSSSAGRNNEEIPTRFPPKSDKIKKMVRRGIPSEWRGNAWFFYAGGYDKLRKHKGLYNKLVVETRDIQNKETEVIERDLFRTFPDNIYFNASISKDPPTREVSYTREETALIKSLRRVLTAFAHYQPQIGYCQSLNFLVGLLLLFMDEERSFWMLVILTERIIPNVHSADLEGVHTDQGVLMLCVKEYLPTLWDTLGTDFEGERLKEDNVLARLPPVTLVTSSWFMSLFVGVLPIETALRVWDILWYEGSKTIFRISLTIFKMCIDSPEFQSQQTPGAGENQQVELFQFMQGFPKQILDPNLLIDHCFKKIGGYGFGSLSQGEIDKCRDFVARQRQKMHLNTKRKDLTEMTEEEKQSLMNSTSGAEKENIHDVYGFHRSIMSGIVWNKSISNKMKRRFTGKRA